MSAPTAISRPCRVNRLVSTAIWAAILVGALAWYGKFRVADLIVQTPFRSSFHGNDFVHLYLGSWLLTHGMDPYDAGNLAGAAYRHGLVGADGLLRLNPYVYLPFTGLVLSPLTLASPPTALRAWFVVNHLLVLASIVLMFRSFDLLFAVRNLAMATSLAAVCYPLHRTLSAGQLNGALLFLFALVFELDRRNRHTTAGAVAAFAFLFKLMPGVLLLYFAWRGLTSPKDPVRRDIHAWDGGIWMILLGLVFLVASVVALALAPTGSLREGIGRHVEFRTVLSEMGYGRSTWDGLGRAYYREPTNQSFNSFFHHIATTQNEAIRPWTVLGPERANRLTRLATAACYLTAFLVLWLRRRRTWRQDAPTDRSMPYAIVMLVGLLTPSIYWDHYALIALWPFMALHARFAEGERTVSFAGFVFLVMALGRCLEPGAALTGLLLGAAIACGAVLVARGGLRGGQAFLWGVAGAFLFARFPFDAPPFREGLGLLAMSIRLWGTLLLLGLCLIESLARPFSSRTGRD
ncbi:DUF2029 domain-containing protein [Candidatus Sumerlaeota bacterium]|nr:DUF2029 domain-containing protein [Candidatus Sumerlaeota bacterium]